MAYIWRWDTNKVVTNHKSGVVMRKVSCIVSNTIFNQSSNIHSACWHYFYSQSVSILFFSLVYNSTHTYTWWCRNHSYRDTLGTICIYILWVSDSDTHLHFKSWSTFYQLHALTHRYLANNIVIELVARLINFLFTAGDVNKELLSAINLTTPTNQVTNFEQSNQCETHWLQ
jgi:hypothetical protein